MLGKGGAIKAIAERVSRARLNLIAHFLSLIAYKELTREKVELPKRSKKDSYEEHRLDREPSAQSGSMALACQANSP